MPETSIKNLPSGSNPFFLLPDTDIGATDLEVGLPGDDVEDLFSSLEGLPALTLTRQHGNYFGHVDDMGS